MVVVNLIVFFLFFYFKFSFEPVFHIGSYFKNIFSIVSVNFSFFIFKIQNLSKILKFVSKIKHFFLICKTKKAICYIFHHIFKTEH